MKKYKKNIYPLVALLLFLFLDQVTKLLAVTRLKGMPDYPLIPDILTFSYLENTGAAFSSFLGKRGFLITLTVCVMLFVLWEYLKIPDGKRFLPMRVSFLLLIGGGVGNLIDRVINGYVVDFIYFVPIDFPKFNIADCYVTVGMILLCILCFFYYKDEELSFLFQHKPRKKMPEK